MDVRTGEIIAPENLKEHLENMNPQDRQYIKRMAVLPTGKQLRRNKVGRNELCPCGSKRKFKKCCLVLI